MAREQVWAKAYYEDPEFTRVLFKIFQPPR